MRIASFNVENLDDLPPEDPRKDPTFTERIAVLRPMLLRLRADIICFQEVHGQDIDGEPRQLRALKTVLEETPYAGHTLASTTLKNKPDVERFRNLVVAIPPDHTFEEVREVQNTLVNPPQYSFVTATGQQEPKQIRWERPSLYCRIRRPDGTILHIVNVHFKSKNPTNVPGQKINNFTWETPAGWAEGFFVSSMKRVGAAFELRCFVDQLFEADPQARIILCGDFNAETHEVPIEALRGEVESTGNPAHSPFVLFPCESSVPDSLRFTLYHHGRKNLLDHLLASRSMISAFTALEIHTELLHDESRGFAFDKKFPEPDHAPVIAEFDDDLLSFVPSQGLA